MYLIEEARLTIDESCKLIIMNASTIVIFQEIYFGHDRFMFVADISVTLSHGKIIWVRFSVWSSLNDFDKSI